MPSKHLSEIQGHLCYYILTEDVAFGIHGGILHGSFFIIIIDKHITQKLGLISYD